MRNRNRDITLNSRGLNIIIFISFTKLKDRVVKLYHFETSLALRYVYLRFHTFTWKITNIIKSDIAIFYLMKIKKVGCTYFQTNVIRS